MTRKIMLWTVLAMILAMVTAPLAADLIGPKVEYKILTGEEPLPEVQAIPYNPGLIASPGQLVGTTQYDYQSNGTSGNRAAVDTQGGVHFAWMNGVSYPNTRAVYFNYVDNTGSWLVPEQGQALSQVNGAGYCQMAITPDDRAAVGYHSSGSNFVIYALDAFTGFGIFDYYDPPDMLGYRCYWPYLTVDRNGNTHVVSCENAPTAGDPQVLGYTRSTNGGVSWSTLQRVDTLETISQSVVASPVSDKVAIVYSHPQNYDSQWNNDIYYIESDNGLSWNWNAKVNVTDYGAPDSLFAYTDLSAIYDYNDNLHIIWNAQYVTTEGIYYKTFLLHYDNGTQNISTMNESDSLWLAGCSYGAWNRPITKMSMGAYAGAPDAIFAAYTQFDTSDCSAGGFANGDIYMQYSINGGRTWETPQNVTNTPTPGCSAGDCESDHWSALADRVDENLHIIYIEDRDAGGIPQTEGSVTTNAVRYLEVQNPVLGIDGHGSRPTTFDLSQNYPNPFNARTNIEFDLKNDSYVELSVYDITGARVSTLVNRPLSAGSHSINWDANEVASGVYYYTLKANDETTTRKMTLLK